MRTAQEEPTVHLGFRENGVFLTKLGVEEAQAEIRCQKKVIWYL